MPLPLKARVAVRDLWEAEDSDAQKALCSVQETVGCSVRCTPDFAVLWEELQAAYEDTGEFVAAVAGLVRIWCQELNSLLNDDAADEAWADKFLETIGESGPKIISLLVTIGKPGVAGTTWDLSSSSFTLALPSTRVAFAPNHSAELREGLFGVFEAKEPVPVPDEWADLGDPKVASGAEPTVVVPVVAKGATAFLPTLNDVPRPDVLQLQPPYRLMVHDRGHCIEVHGSHSPSLELLAGYLEKWCQVIPSRSNRPPMATVRLNRSAFGLGVVYDALTVAPYDSREPTLLPPVLILNLVENVLGYKLVNEYPQSWRFIREVALKKAA
ncbi:hypothetical protein ISF_07718 [Cordyceps fumosorosea ARSEF 2679]|uniref:Uncharacterized protein n=1 Tax=Cordyceps fumosorosea (strain ARSEF 2679) TaxID=1081104 RepID=A0A162MHG2_CORFA|nr:hypothetical protein ISF_07718 [Cordyceps fumosorosea ARSEF 2679]OAA56120.1 hypothetical protein ISF_07718 [Cordyceps fumosorosea ARSEF 2679]